MAKPDANSPGMGRGLLIEYEQGRMLIGFQTVMDLLEPGESLIAVTYNIDNSEHGIPSRVTICLLRTSIPHLHNRDKRWSDGCFKRTQDKSRRHQSTEIRCCSHTAERSAPAEYHRRTELADGY